MRGVENVELGKRLAYPLNWHRLRRAPGSEVDGARQSVFRSHRKQALNPGCRHVMLINLPMTSFRLSVLGGGRNAFAPLARCVPLAPQER